MKKINWTVLLLFVWLVLAVANIVSLFKVCTFLLILNYAFGFFNALICLALLPEFFRHLRGRSEFFGVKEIKEEKEDELPVQ